MRLDQRPPIGEKVHLRPRTKTAGTACREYREAEVVSYDRWPLVQVRPLGAGTDGGSVLVHADDCGLRPARGKPTGDMAGTPAADDRPPARRVRPKPMQLPPGWEEPTLPGLDMRPGGTEIDSNGTGAKCTY